jgi:hypothetical protein
MAFWKVDENHQLPWVKGDASPKQEEPGGADFSEASARSWKLWIQNSLFDNIAWSRHQKYVARGIVHQRIVEQDPNGQ